MTVLFDDPSVLFDDPAVLFDGSDLVAPPTYTSSATSGDDILDLVDGRRQFAYSFIFEVRDSAGRRTGRVTPLAAGSEVVEVQTTRTAIWTLSSLRLRSSDMDDLNIRTDRIQVYMRLSTGDLWPIGRFMFAGRHGVIGTAGTVWDNALTDQSLILDQAVERTVSVRRGSNIKTLVETLASEVGVEEMSIVTLGETIEGATAWPPGTSRYKIIKDAAALVGCFPPYFDAEGKLWVRPVPNLATAKIDHTYAAGGRIVAGSIVETDDSWRTPNRYIVIGGSGEEAIVGVYDIPASAPHSIARIGYAVTETIQMQAVANTKQAEAAARAAAVRGNRGYRSVSFESTPDPRHGVFDVVKYRGDQYLEMGWALPLKIGGAMRHSLVRTWTENDVR